MPDAHPAATARVVHGALLATVLLWAVGYFVLLTLAPPGIPPVRPAAAGALRIVFLATVAVVTFLAVRARVRLQSPRLVEDADVFWRDNRVLLYAAWFGAELGAVAGVVLAWLTGVAFMAGWLPAVGFLALLLASPRALRAR